MGLHTALLQPPPYGADFLQLTPIEPCSKRLEVTAHAHGLTHCRLRDVLWDHTQLYLIMDYVEQDLRQFMDTDARSRSLRNVKVVMTNQCLSRLSVGISQHCFLQDSVRRTFVPGW